MVTILSRSGLRRFRMFSGFLHCGRLFHSGHGGGVGYGYVAGDAPVIEHIDAPLLQIPEQTPQIPYAAITEPDSRNDADDDADKQILHPEIQAPLLDAPRRKMVPHQHRQEAQDEAPDK